MIIEKNHTFAITAHGVSEYLEECVKSVCNQTRKCKVILVTATPNDHITNICKKYEIPIYVNEGEDIIADNWNMALNCPDTKYVTLVHQDDVYSDTFCAKVMKELEKSKKPIISFTDYSELRNGVRVDSTKMLKIKRAMLAPLKIKFLQKSKWVRRRIFSLGNPICCPAVTFNKEALDGPVFSRDFNAVLDYEAWESLSKKDGEFVYCDEILVYHRIHRSSETTKTIGDSRRTREELAVLKRLWPGHIAEFIEKFYGKAQNFNEL